MPSSRRLRACVGVFTALFLLLGLMLALTPGKAAAGTQVRQASADPGETPPALPAPAVVDAASSAQAAAPPNWQAAASPLTLPEGIGFSGSVQTCGWSPTPTMTVRVDTPFRTSWVWNYYYRGGTQQWPEAYKCLGWNDAGLYPHSIVLRASPRSDLPNSQWPSDCSNWPHNARPMINSNQAPRQDWWEGDVHYFRWEWSTGYNIDSIKFGGRGCRQKGYRLLSFSLEVVEIDGIPVSIPADQTNAPCDCPVGCSTQTTNWVGGPINTRTGNYHYSQEDISIAALGGPLRFERSYNSLETGLYTTPLGYGWTHNYDMDLTFPGEAGGEPGKVIVKGCHGSRFRFGDNGDGTYTAWPGVWATLTRTLGVSPTYYLRGVDQSLYVFTSTGQLVEVRDPQGNPIRLTYSGGRLTRVQDATGQRFLAFGYDAQGRLTEVRDPISRTVRYGYGPAGDLTVVTDTRGFTWTYVYTGTHLLYEIRDPLNRVVERTDYDAQGRAVRQWDGLLGPPLWIQYGAGGVVTITDPLGNLTVDRYNGYGALASQSTAAGISRRTYDANLNWRTTTDGNGHTTGYTFNAMGLPERVTDALGNVTRMAYDALNRLTAVTDALGNVTRYEYGQASPLPITVTDALSGLVVNTYNAQGLLVRTVDHGVTTTYGYDSLGQRTAITDALCTGAMNCAPTRYGYDAIGRLITVTDHASRITFHEYDPADHLIRVTQNYTTAGGTNWQNTYNLVTRYEYDRAGNRVAMTDTLGYVTRYGYDAANRLISVTVNYSPTVGPNYQNQWNLTTRYGYDAVGNQIAVTDTLGRVTRNWYDGANRLISTTVNYSPTVGPNYQNQWNITTWYGYDAVGNRVAVTDTLGRVTRYGYDALNRLVVVTDALGAPTRYAYDALGRQVVVTDASGVAVYSTYDALGRLTQTRDALNNITRYGYDSLGRRAVMTDANGVATRYEYDLLGRLTAVVENYKAGQPSDSQTNVRTEYAYNALGNRTVITDARGNATRYTYDALGRLVAEVNPLGYTTRYAYDVLGHRTVVTAADGVVARYAYDALGRLSAVQYPTATVQYAYDALGNRTAMTDTTGVTRWVYDALNRPITISAPYSGTVGYRYDALGNRTQLIYPTGQVVTYTYDAANRLVQVTDYASRFTRYGYDPAGRLLTTTLPNGITTTYRYDGAGRLVNLTHAGRYWVVAAYTYTLDAVGNRIAVVERVLTPNPPDYLPVVMKDYGGAQGMSAPAAEPQIAPFVSPLPIPEPDTSATPFESPLEMPVEDSSSRVPAPFSARLLWSDLSLPLFAPLALISLAGRKRGWRWAWPLAAALLVVAVVTIGASLAGGGVAPAAALAPQPLLSPLPPPGATCTYPPAIAGSRVISYTYDPLYRLKEAAYSSGECYRYAYDRVGNRTTLTTTTALILYQYDAANRLTNVDGMPYTWDNRGNLTSNGVFTYTYDAAGRMVQARRGEQPLALTATLVYTYNGDGLRVAQTINGVRTTFVWNVADGLPQVLATSDGALDIYGLGRIVEIYGNEWRYPLGDALRSMRQWTDDRGYLTYARGYAPYGEDLWQQGSTTSAWGYTGEWQDAQTQMLYLRARWYAPSLGIFLSRDPIRSNHPYQYAKANPINLVDPSGRCASDCECFVAEVERFIALAQSHKLLGAQLDDSWVVQMLGGYYAGFRMTQNVFGCSLAIPPGFIIRDPTPERWPTPGSLLWRVFDDLPVEGAREEALRYGFKRIFYNNTHHYFANFYEAYFYGSAAARLHNNYREASQYRNEGHPYYESAADILVAEVAIRHARQALNAGIEVLPQLLREEACGDSLEDIYEEWVWPNPIVESQLGPPPR